MSAHNFISIEGQRFGALVAVSREGRNRRKYAMWLCHCDCGQKVVISGYNLRCGKRKACLLNGHRHNSNLGRAQFPSEYCSWGHMRMRCYNKNSAHYRVYGGRGIRVCERWRVFANFAADMGHKPHPSYTIERVDVNGHYEPGNCRWATRAEQARNMQRTVYVTYNRKRMLLLDVVAQLGLNRAVVYGRLKMGWPLNEAISLPVRPRKPNKKPS